MINSCKIRYGLVLMLYFTVLFLWKDILGSIISIIRRTDSNYINTLDNCRAVATGLVGIVSSPV